MSKLDRLIAKHTRPQEREDVPKVFDEYLFADSLISALKEEVIRIYKKYPQDELVIRGRERILKKIDLAYNALKGEGK